MFLKVNILSPSGPASIGLLYKEAVGKIMTEGQFVEAVGFSNVLPGSEALKLAMFVGFAAGGIPGVFTALLGAILPPTVMIGKWMAGILPPNSFRMPLRRLAPK